MKSNEIKLDFAKSNLPSTIYFAECCVEICNNVTNTFHAMIRLLLNF